MVNPVSYSLIVMICSRPHWQVVLTSLFLLSQSKAGGCINIYFFSSEGMLRRKCPLRLQIMSTMTKLLGFVRQFEFLIFLTAGAFFMFMTYVNDDLS